MIRDSIISPHLCIATKGQRSRVCGKLFLSSVVPLVVNGGVHRDPNTIAAQRAARFFSNTRQKMPGGKHVKARNGSVRIFWVFALTRGHCTNLQSKGKGAPTQNPCPSPSPSMKGPHIESHFQCLVPFSPLTYLQIWFYTTVQFLFQES